MVKLSPMATAAGLHRRGRSSLSPSCLSALLVVVIQLLLLHHLLIGSLDAVQFSNKSFDDSQYYPTPASLSTGWTFRPALRHALNFSDSDGRWTSFQVRLLLLRRRREGFGPTYACGFYGYHYLPLSFTFGIFIVQTNRSGDVQTGLRPEVVWTANEERSVGENATLELGSGGDLVLTDADGAKVWSTNTSGDPVVGINLTEHGNLVLFGGEQKNNTIFFWDSFDYPTDTLLPGQKLRVGGQGLTTEGGYHVLAATSMGLINFRNSTLPGIQSFLITLNVDEKFEYFEFVNGTISTSSSSQVGRYYSNMPPSHDQFLRLELDQLAVYEWRSTHGAWEKNIVLLLRDSYRVTGGFYSTARLSARWTINSPMAPIIKFADGSGVMPLLLGQRRDGSSGPTYACGFYCSPPGPCDSFLFAILIIHANITTTGGNLISLGAGVPLVVWAANRDCPVRANAMLQLGSDGDLVLTDADGTKVWSSDTSGKSVAGINLTEAGNLVLFGGGHKDNQTMILWDSFNYPTDSLVPGQKLRVGQSLKANDSATNATEGLYYLSATWSGLMPYIKSEPPRSYALPLTDGTSNVKKIDYFEFINGRISTTSWSGLYVPPPPSQFLRLESDGHLRVYQWRPTNGDWIAVAELLFMPGYQPSDCLYPTTCGRYGICSENIYRCTCPEWDGESRHFMFADGQNPSLGCKEVTPLSCGDSQSYHKLLRLDNASYFIYNDLEYPSHNNLTIDEIGCSNACANNCSCKAAFFQQGDRKNSCYLAPEVFSLRSTRRYDPSSAVFIKVQIPVTLVTTNSTGTSRSSKKDSGMAKGRIIGSILAALFLLFLVLSISYILLARKKSRNMMPEDKMEEDDLEQVSGVPRRFSLEELTVATDGFSKKLGQGGFGSVYDGRIDGNAVAVKRLDSVGQGRKEFLAEVQTIGKIHHVNLVKLIGYCAEKFCRLLVYEFMPNGSLDRWIFHTDRKASFDWKTRYKIILGVARGLSYLHEECNPRIAHLDIKPQNILLDDKFNAKVSDFGLAKLIDRDQSHVVTRMRGTPGYLAPEWLSSMITEKVDIYSFGVVVLEIICGRRNLHRSQPEPADATLVALLKRKSTVTGEMLDLVDESIKNRTDFDIAGAMKMMKTVVWCLQDQNKRPSMSTVVKVLEGVIDVESNLEDINVEECNAADDARGSAPVFASILSGPR